MAINATNSGTRREPIPAGNYIARCYQMIHIGTVAEFVLGEQKIMNKVRIGWELPTELKVFNEERGEQPCVISAEYTLSLNEKANLRKMLASWRGKNFTEEEAKCFDITKLLGVPCMLNIIHKPSKKDPSILYEEIGSVSPMPKGVTIPEQINNTFILDYDDNFTFDKVESLPDFIKTKLKSSLEYQSKVTPQQTNIRPSEMTDVIDDLPF